MYNVGDRVEIKKGLVKYSVPGIGVNHKMVRLEGQIATITHREVGFNTKYKIDLDQGCWTWAEEYFERLVEHDINVNKDDLLNFLGGSYGI